jgi:hypothetical protein
LIALADAYYEGMVHGRPDTLRNVFEEGARFQGVRDGVQVRRGLGEFLAMVTDGAGAKAKAIEERCEVELIDITGPLAILKVRDTFRGRTYVDYLTAVRLPVGWRLVNKAFTTVDEPCDAPPLSAA